MFNRHKKGMEEAESVRYCKCTHCGRELLVSPKAFSVNCRYCNQRVCIENHLIETHHTITNIETSGDVAITPSGHVRAQLHAGNIRVEGQIFGNVTADGKVQVARHAQITGDVVARELEVKDGASLHGFFSIGQPPQT